LPAVSSFSRGCLLLLHLPPARTHKTPTPSLRLCFSAFSNSFSAGKHVVTKKKSCRFSFPFIPRSSSLATCPPCHVVLLVGRPRARARITGFFFYWRPTTHSPKDGASPTTMPNDLDLDHSHRHGHGHGQGPDPHFDLTMAATAIDYATTATFPLSTTWMRDDPRTGTWGAEY
jgi:hypothetical protein